MVLPILFLKYINKKAFSPLPGNNFLLLYTIGNSFDLRKLRVGVKYYIVHMYSMPYYTYGSTVKFLFLEPTALIYIYIYNYISKVRHCNEDLRGIRNFKIERVIR